MKKPSHRRWSCHVIMYEGSISDILGTSLRVVSRNTLRGYEVGPRLPFLGETIRSCSCRKKLTGTESFTLDMMFDKYRVRLYCSFTSRCSEMEATRAAMKMAKELTGKTLDSIRIMSRDEGGKTRGIVDLELRLSNRTYRWRTKKGKYWRCFKSHVMWKQELT